jgi:hypothetical protein
MTMPGWNDPVDEVRNPHRAEERRHARDEMEARLREREIFLSGSESDEDILAMVNAVEEFEARVARLGGDSMVNTPESSDPDEERFVVPIRRDDESVEPYVSRVRDAANRLA